MTCLSTSSYYLIWRFSFGVLYSCSYLSISLTCPNFYRYLACHFFLCYFFFFTISLYNASLYSLIENFLLSFMLISMLVILFTDWLFAFDLFLLIMEILHISMSKRLFCSVPLMRIKCKQMLQ